MVTLPHTRFIAVMPALLACVASAAQDAGSIRGLVNDRDFESPLAGCDVQIIETGARTTSSDQGDYVFGDVAPGTYTLVFSKDGYQRQVRTDVVVTGGSLTDADAFLSGDFTDMEEFVVQDVELDAGTESALLQIRLDSPGLLDSIGAELLSQAGAGDAAAALNLVAGATVQDGKYATVRGLPDRYVQTLLNGIRLPTSDENKRAVQLDLFPSAVIESIQVTKSFTPDQQGDASGGGVNIVLKGIPDETFVKFKGEYKWNSQVRNRGDFLTYQNAGVSYWGDDDGGRDLPPVSGDVGGIPLYDFNGRAFGTTTGQAPQMYKWSGDFGIRHEVEDGPTFGAFASLFYDQDAAYAENAVDDSWVSPVVGGNVNDPSTWIPQTSGQDPVGQDEAFQTAFFDITEGVESVQWGALATGGMEWGGQKLTVTYLYTRTAEDKAVLAEDTRGKDWYVDTYFPGQVYDPYDPRDPLNVDHRDSAPWLRTQTLSYTERTLESLQLSGSHEFPFEEDAPTIPGAVTFTGIVADWNLSRNSSRQYQPDKAQFGSLWLPANSREVIPGFDLSLPNSYQPLQPGPSFVIGNVGRIYKNIEETDLQYQGNFTLEFEQWTDDPGYLKFGLFHDNLDRTYDQESFANYRLSPTDPRFNYAWASDAYPYYGPPIAGYPGYGGGPYNGDAVFPGDPEPGPGWDEYWSDVAPYQNVPISQGGDQLNPDVDYTGNQRILAYYAMADVPLFTGLNVIGGFRFESTEIAIVNDPGEAAIWVPPTGTNTTQLNPGDADVAFQQFDVLPSLSLVAVPDPTVTLRAAFSRTVARQTFKELSPIIQQEYLGGPVFIGNPDLQMSSVTNYDLRADWTPYDGSLFSASWFRKDLVDPIEYVNRGTPSFSFTTPANFPAARLEGFELEGRQNLGDLWEPLRAITIGGNASFINSRADFPDESIAQFGPLGITTTDMTGAPTYLYNLYATLGLRDSGTDIGVFWTAQGDTLLAAASVNGNQQFVPPIYAKPVGTLNITVTQRLFDHFQIFFKAKNLTNPSIDTVYRTPDGSAEVLNTRFTSGIDLSLGISASFTF